MTTETNRQEPWGPGSPCEICGLPYPDLRKEPIVPYWKGGTNDPDNYQRICPNCRNLKRTREMNEGIRPFPLPPI